MQPADLLPDKKKRLSDFFYLMQRIKAAVVQTKLWVDSPTTAQALQMFQAVEQEAVWDALEPERATKKRRLNQLSWSTVVKDTRKVLREARGRGRAGEQGD